ncbi:hypothetical protein SAMN04488168_16218 [Bacillus sp. 491mf]|nr:hypothetical protein SAMN04488168_16218 [Bacillus sp. 491mf]
MEQSGSSSGS